MSFILDALKKSDAERQLGHTPTLGGQNPAGATDLANELGPLTWVLSSVLAAALLVIGWVWFQVPEVPQTADPIAQPAAEQIRPEQPPVTEAGDSAPAEAPQQVMDTGAASQAPEEQAGSEPLAAVRDYRPRRPDESSAGTAVPGRDEPAESADEPPAHLDDDEQANGSVGESSAIDAQQAASQIQSAPAQAENSSQQQRQRGPQQTRPNDQADPADPVRPEPIFRYELPANIREQLPAFNIAVQVYDEDPAARFAIINGKRLLEGDALQAGLVLKEVRRSDLVFTYRRYEFKVTP